MSMKKTLFSVFLSLCAVAAHADVIKTIQAGATDQTVTLRIIDSTDGTPETGVAFNTSGIDLEYWRHGANAATDITEATQTVNGAHSDGGFVHVGHGVYRLDLPDAAVASGVTAVDVYGTVTGMIVIGGTVDLSPPVNVVALAADTITATAIATDAIGAAEIAANAIAASEIATDAIDADAIAAAAIAASEIATDAIGAAEVADGTITAATFASAAIDATAIAADAIGASEIAADAIASSELAATAAGELADQVWEEALADHSGTAGSTAEALDNAGSGGVAPEDLGIIADGTAQAATATTLRLAAGETFADDEIIGATCVITGGSAGVGQSRTVTDYVSSTDTATVATWTTTPTGTITYNCFGTAAGSSGSVTIAAGGISASSFAAGAIDASAIAADAIGASEIATDAIGAAELASAAIAADEIATDAIGAAEIATDAIGAAEIAANALTTAEIATGAISSDEVADDSIDAGAIAASAIGASEIATDAIGAAEIAADAIAAAEIANAAIDAATFAAGAIDATAVAADAIGASEIAANAITSSEIADNAIDAAATAADFSTEIQDVDVEQINGATVLGSGTEADPWNGE
jgi:hypothetical protein